MKDGRRVHRLAGRRERPFTQRIEDISGEGYHIVESRHVSCVVQSDLPEKVFMLERLEWVGREGMIQYSQAMNRIEYRLGYYIVR